MRTALVLSSILLGLVPAVAGEPRLPHWSSGPTAVFFADFRNYPPAGNVDIAIENCDISIFFDETPHLRLLEPGKSRFSFRFRLPRAPADAQLAAVHLASSGPQGRGESPISILVNGRPVVEDWNVGETAYTETRWPVGDKLRSGRNEIEWRAGALRTHYWLRSAALYVHFDRPVEVELETPRVEHALFWEGRFSQCSYNALATVLDHYYGIEPWAGDRESYEKRTFVAALEKYGLGGYYGWAPWTSYMVQAGTIEWNGRRVDDLEAERFPLRTSDLPEVRGQEALVRYQPGEKSELEKALKTRLERGPVIIWTPYAAVLDRGQNAWRHVRAVDRNTDAVRFHPNVTHSVVVNLEGTVIKVYDNSWPNGVWSADAGTIVATAAAMAASVRIDRGGGKSLRGDGFGGIEGDAYNVAFSRKRAKAQPGAEKPSSPRPPGDSRALSGSPRPAPVAPTPRPQEAAGHARRRRNPP